MIKRVATILLSLATVINVGGQVLSLKECIAMGVANNLSLSNSLTDIEKGRIGVKQRKSMLLPDINGVFQFTDFLKTPANVTTGTLLGNDFPDDPTWQTVKSMQYNVTAGVQMVLPLYNQTIYATIDVAKTIGKISELSYEKGVEDLTMQIGKVYYLAQCSAEQIYITEENIERMESLYAISEALFQQGMVLEIDLNRVKVNMQMLRTQLSQFSSLYRQQLNMLRFLINMGDDESDIAVERFSVSLPADYEGVLVDFLPEIKLATEQKVLLEKQIKATRSGYIPSISFIGYAGAIGYQDRMKDFFHSKSSYQNWFGNCYIGLSIKIPLFDASRKSLQISQYKRDIVKAENNIELLRSRLSKDFDNARLQLSQNIDIYRTQFDSYNQACEVYAITCEQYREGVASMISLLQDDMQLRSAQAACVQALSQCYIARLELLRLTGQLANL